MQRRFAFQTEDVLLGILTVENGKWICRLDFCLFSFPLIPFKVTKTNKTKQNKKTLPII